MTWENSCYCWSTFIIICSPHSDSDGKGDCCCCRQPYKLEYSTRAKDTQQYFIRSFDTMRTFHKNSCFWWSHQRLMAHTIRALLHKNFKIYAWNNQHVVSFSFFSTPSCIVCFNTVNRSLPAFYSNQIRQNRVELLWWFATSGVTIGQAGVRGLLYRANLSCILDYQRICGRFFNPSYRGRP